MTQTPDMILARVYEWAILIVTVSAILYPLFHGVLPIR
jgi:hypothetical protein